MFSLKKTLNKLTTLHREKEKTQILTSSLAFKQLVATSLLNELLHGKSSFKKLVFLCSCEKEARKWSGFFSFYAKGKRNSYEVEELFTVPYWDLLKSQEHEIRRFRSLEALNFLKDSSLTGVVVATPEGFMQKIFDTPSYEKESFALSISQEQDPLKLEEKLKNIGYRETTYVREKGFFARRGGVFDIFPVGSKTPIRLEFFSSEIQTIHSFEEATGKTLEQIFSTVKILPSTSHFFSHEERKKLYQKFYEFLDKKGFTEKHKLALLQSLEDKRYLLEFEKVLPSLEGSCYTENLNLVGDDCFLVSLDSLLELKSAFSKTKEGLSLVYEALKDYEEVLSPSRDHFFSDASFDIFLSKNAELVFTKHDIEDDFYKILPDESWKDFALLKKSFETTKPSSILNDLISLEESLCRVVCVFSSEKEKNLFAQLLEEKSLSYKVSKKTLPEELQDILSYKEKDSFFLLTHGKIEGFFLAELEKIIFFDGSIFFPKKKNFKRKTQKKVFSREAFIAGDYVIHELHGIGRFDGLAEVSVSSGFFDFLKLTYKNDTILYVPLDRFELLRKYEKGGSNSSRVTLDKLGSGSWKVRKKKVEENIRLLATGLLQLEAQRKLAVAPSYGRPGSVYEEFASDFPYEETKDQLKAIEDVEADLQSSFYMDRLLVGDVGFGKTEVAMRAAMYTVLEGYQVLFFVPTTILCKQHYLRFISRFNKYGVRLGILSRHEKKESKQTLDDFLAGKIDILIGTHALLSLKLESSRVGLVILDEEHKLGVQHKKILREKAGHVNILTMTATPLPRTLNMAVLGLRDISLIQEPPSGRLSVKTFFAEKNALVINNAINFELKRSGQIIYLHNTIEYLPFIKKELEERFQGLKVTLIHGKLKPGEVSSHMKDFLEGTSQLLLATTIVESGVDIPNVNTLIVSDSERYGLSQLHQIRGRVGRSTTQSYAYFFYEHRASLTEAARGRMEALLSHESLGAGFHLASQDMMLRGVGNLLGSEQSGDVISVGIDLYLDMLEEVICELKEGQKPPLKNIPVEIKLKQKVGIPKSYVALESERLNFYREILQASTEEEVKEIFLTMKDLYGAFPKEVDSFYDLSLIRVLLVSFDAFSFKELKENRLYELLAIGFSEEASNFLLQQKTAQYMQGDSRVLFFLSDRQKPFEFFLELFRKLSAFAKPKDSIDS